MKKILIATDVFAPTPGGEPVAIEQLVRGLVRRGHEVHVIAPADGLRSFKEDVVEFHLHRIGSLPINGKRKLRFAYDVRRVKKIISEVRPDIVHIKNEGPIGRTSTSSAISYKLPIVGTSHVLQENLLSPFRMPKQLENIIGKYFMRRVVGLYRNFDAVSAPSPYAAKAFEGFGLTSVISISNGVDLNRFKKEDVAKQKILRKKYKLSEKPIVLYLGRLDREKKVDVLLRAAAKFAGDFQLLIGGMGVDEKRLVELAHNLGLLTKVQFLGVVEDECLPALYQLADIFVMPGDVELQSIATLEAMASSLPVVACNSMALPNLVEHGTNGYLYKRNDPVDLAKHVSDLLKNKAKRSKMGSESLKLVQEHHIDRVIDKYEAMYEVAIERRKKT